MATEHVWVWLTRAVASGKALSSALLGTALGSGGTGLLECIFLLVWSRCPLIIATDQGRCFCKDCSVSPTNSGTCPIAWPLSRWMRPD